MTTFILPDDPAQLKGIIADKDQVIAELQGKIQLLHSMIYGPSSEKRKPADSPTQQQLSLFDEVEATADLAAQEPVKTIQVPAHQRKKGGRKPLPQNLPRVEVVHDIPEEQKVCACGCALTRIGEETSEKLDVVPQKIQVIRSIRPKYACRACEGVEDDGPTVKIAPLEPQLIPQGIATPGLVADIMVAKYADAQPFYRQEARFARMGIEITRSTMCNWVLLVGRALEPLQELLLEEVLSGPHLGLDETPLQVLGEPGRANTTVSYMWLVRGGPPEKPGVYFHYAPTRSGSVACELVGNFQGYVQADGYAGYEELARRPGVRMQGCMTHMRRKFLDVLKAAGRKKPKPEGGLADTVLEQIGRLYGIEDKARKQKLDYDAIRELRLAEAKPILDELKQRLDARAGSVPPKGLLGKAIAYARNHWNRIVVYLEHGWLRPDNNLVENAIRPFAVGRKNWLFSGSPRGAKVSAGIYSLIETAKANGLEPYAYLRFLFERLPKAATKDALRALLPQRITADQLALPA